MTTPRISSELSAEALTWLPGDQVPILLHVRNGEGPAAVRGWLAHAGLTALGSARVDSLTRISTLVPRDIAAELVEQLGERSDVFFVERVHRLGFFNDRSAGSVQSGSQGAAAGMTPIWARGLRGEGQIVGMIDSGLDVDACQFSSDGKLPKVNTFSADGYGREIDDSHRKVIAYDFLFSCAQFPDEPGCEMPEDERAWDTLGHGTHCAGSMIGAPLGEPNGGMAPAAKMVVQDGGVESNPCSEMPGLGCPVVDLYPIFEQAYEQGVRIHNNSYGDNEEAQAPLQSNYSARSQDVDRFTWDHKDMLFVFAAGNSGMNNRDFSVGSPSTNKNGLSVGSLRTEPTATSDENISTFSSRGWTADGRIKPDIMAPGCTTSAGNDSDIGSDNCTEDSGCGTSYAAPVLVGAAALARQYFTDGFYPSGAKNPADARVPSAALLKATLLNGAVGISGDDNAGEDVSSIPSNEQGWGRVQLDRSLVFADSPRKLFVDDPSTGFAAGDTSTIRYTFSGVASTQPFKVTLVWTDFAGSVDAAPRAPRVDDFASLNSPILVNDLDLTVSAAADSWLGNVFAQGQSMAGGMADRRNNVEQVSLEAPSSGDITVSVTAANIQQAGQDYALVVTGQWQSAGRADAMPTAGAAAPSGAAGQGGAGGSVSAPDQAGGGAAVGAGAAGSSGGAVPPARAGATGAVGMTAGAGSTATAGAMAASSSPPTTAAPAAASSDDGCRTASGDASPSTTAVAAWLVAAWLLLRRRRFV